MNTKSQSRFRENQLLKLFIVLRPPNAALTINQFHKKEISGLQITVGHPTLADQK